MAITWALHDDGVAVITMDNPPVNALTVADTWALRDTFRSVAADEGVRAVLLTAAGRGFNAGIDRKELQTSEGFASLLSAAAAGEAVCDQIRRTPVPVVAAVHDVCMGLGVGLVASCDIVVASVGTRFALPEVDDELLGCAAHLARLVPPFKLRQMVLTCEPVSAERLFEWGSVQRLCDPDELAGAALGVARAIAARSPRAVGAAKGALDAIDRSGRVLARGVRTTQGLAHELSLSAAESLTADGFLSRPAVRFE
jgi:enoyl-CoA hydratase